MGRRMPRCTTRSIVLQWHRRWNNSSVVATLLGIRDSVLVAALKAVELAKAKSGSGFVGKMESVVVGRTQCFHSCHRHARPGI